MPLAPYKIPSGRYLKNGSWKPPGKKTFKWFSTPHRTINVTREGEYQPIKYEPFNPGSRSHIKKWMEEDYGYTFPYYTEKGSPKVDPESLDNMNHPAGKMLKRFLKVGKDQSQIGNGAGSLISHYNENTKGIHCRVDTNGTITGRFSVNSPNMAQIPSQEEFRELFSAPEGWTFVGVDFSQQELVNLAHFLYPYDGGAYAKTVADGNKEDETDPHNVHKRLAGLDTRGQAKVFGFQYLYGAGEVVLGAAVRSELLADYTDKEYATAKKKIDRRIVIIDDMPLFPIKKDKYIQVTELLIHQAIYGNRIVTKFEKNFPGLSELIKALQKEAKDYGTITIPGGRVMPCRSSRNALNTAMQSLGGTAMKYYLVAIHRELAKEGIIHGKHFIQQATIYDEVDMIVKTEYAEAVGKTLERCFSIISEELSLNTHYKGEALLGGISIDTDTKLPIANSWWGCH